MAKKKSIVFEFVCQQLEKNPEADYATVKAASEAEGYTIYPIMYGRAKAKLGLVEVRPRGTRKREKEQAARLTQMLREHSAAAADANGTPATSLEVVLRAMKQGDAEKERYRAALTRIHEILTEVLAQSPA